MSEIRPSSPSRDQLAERLRKSIQAQRSPSPSQSNGRAASIDGSPARPKKMTLEERLKASLAVREASASTTTPGESRNPSSASPSEPNPLSPTSTPLPDSPQVSTNNVSTTQPEPLDLSTDVHPLSPAPSTSLVSPPNPEPPLETTPPLGPSNIDALQEKLKLMEQQFSDVSQSFKKLQKEKLAADAVLKELTPLDTVTNSEALRDYIVNTKQQTELAKAQTVSLASNSQNHDARVEELRETHRLESTSQSQLIESLRNQLQETETILKNSSASSAQDSGKSAEIEKLTAELAKSQEKAKEEEEKRTKAVTLLKTVRQKLVKSEKDKEEALKEVHSLKEREGNDRQQLLGDKAQLQVELQNAQVERDRAIAGLKAQFDREVSGLRERQDKDLSTLRDRHEKEVAALRGQFELDAVATKSLHTKELSLRDSRIANLEETVASLTREKNQHFDDLQQHQATFESSQSHLETLQAENADLQFRLRDALERTTVLSEELADLQRGQEVSFTRSSSSPAPDDVARLIADAETRHELKLAELKRTLSSAERERSESEAQWSKRLREKVQENDELRRTLGSADKSREEEEELVSSLQAEIQRLTGETENYQRHVAALAKQIDKMVDFQAVAQNTEQAHNARVATLEKIIEESKQKETNLRQEKKNLRDELRKVQSSAALLEKQRNGGVGYWATGNNGRGTDSRTSISSATDEGSSRTASPAPSSSSKSDEEVNLEYLRNVILQFLEHKEMRPNLVKVLSIILHFTPQETRRLMAKV